MALLISKMGYSKNDVKDEPLVNMTLKNSHLNLMKSVKTMNKKLDYHSVRIPREGYTGYCSGVFYNGEEWARCFSTEPALFQT